MTTDLTEAEGAALADVAAAIAERRYTAIPNALGAWGRVLLEQVERASARDIAERWHALHRDVHAITDAAETGSVEWSHAHAAVLALYRESGLEVERERLPGPYDELVRRFVEAINEHAAPYLAVMAARARYSARQNTKSSVASAGTFMNPSNCVVNRPCPRTGIRSSRLSVTFVLVGTESISVSPVK